MGEVKFKKKKNFNSKNTNFFYVQDATVSEVRVELNSTGQIVAIKRSRIAVVEPSKSGTVSASQTPLPDAGSNTPPYDGE